MTLPRSARLGFLLAVLVPLVAGAEGAAERFFFGVGANDGGPTRARLRYAGKDATAMARLLRELGGVPDENVVVLLDPGREDFFSAWASLLGRMRAARARGQRVELFFYYSGHSDEAGLIWGDERLDYRELRRALREPPAEVVVAILDSCASGALTRLKGGTIRPAFLVDESTRVRGHAILTSSSADEVAQESDRLRGSFFTHHLMAGLRGAADMRGAGRVTLTEAYRYAFEETLAQTERTLGGPQHPAYEIELHGSGDLVVTDLRKVSATLDLAPALVGRVFVRDAAGDLVVEARKREGIPLRLGLSPGAYVVTVVHGENRYETSVNLAPDQASEIGPGDLRLVLPEEAVSRGDADWEETYHVVPFEFSVLPSLSTYGGPRPTITRFSLFLLAATGDRLDGTQAGLGIGRMREDVEGVQIAGLANLAGDDVDGLQAALGLNRAGGDVKGVQMAIGLNIAAGEVDHLQMAVGANLVFGTLDGLQLSVGPSLGFGRVEGMQVSASYAHADGRMDGIQLAGGMVLGADHVKGIQAAAGAAFALGSVEGVQVAGGATLASGDLSGFQASAGANWIGGSLVGFQLAAGFNQAGRVDGSQLAAVNGAGDVDGFQVGVLNFARDVDGVQIGLVNFARSVDVPIGLLNIVSEGRFRIGLWGSELAMGHLSLKTGSPTVHSILTAGIRPERARGDEINWSLGAGLGLHLSSAIRWIDFFEPEVLVTTVFEGADAQALIPALRLGVGWDLARRLAIFAGISANLSVQWDDLRDERLGVAPTLELGSGRRSSVRVWPGFFAGIEI